MDYRVIIEDPTGERYGLPTYHWKHAPDGLLTRRQLAAKGLRKGGQEIAAQMLRARKRRPTEPLIAYLYREDLAKPQFTKSPAKQAAVWTAAHSRYKCDGPCHRRWPELDYIPRFGLCEECRDGKHGPLTTDDDEHEENAA
jgi:hypothetical protein